MSGGRVVVHTDVVLDHLLHRGRERSVLRTVMGTMFCYTTVFNAIELFSLARSAPERRTVERALSAVKILGLNGRHATRYGRRIARGMDLPRMNTLVAGICLDSRLPLLTGRPEEFRGATGLVVIPASAVKEGQSAAELLRGGVTMR